MLTWLFGWVCSGDGGGGDNKKVGRGIVVVSFGVVAGGGGSGEGGTITIIFSLIQPFPLQLPQRIHSTNTPVAILYR